MPALAPQSTHPLPDPESTGILPTPPSPLLARTSGSSRNTIVSLCLILGAFLFYTTAIRDGHDWGGDHAQYILHAKAIVQGLDYAPPPGFILNPYLPWVPVAYPPLYPLCIAGILALLGLNFIALKIQIVAFFSVALYAYWRLLRSFMPAKVALAALAFLSFSPYYLKYSNKLLSEIPYLAVSLFTLIAAERFFRPRSSLREAAGFSLLLVLACCTRSAGLTLIVAAPAYALIFRRTHLLRALLVSGIAFGVLCAISWDMIGIYLNQTQSDPLRVLAWLEGKPSGYFQQMMRYFALHPRAGSILGLLVNAPVTAVYLGLCALGAGHLLWKRRIRYRDAYAAVYVAMIFVYPLPKLRYLLPILPLLSIYAFQGLRIGIVLLRKTSRFRLPPLLRTIFRYRFFYPALLYLPLFAVYWCHYALQPATPGANILKDPHVRDLFAVVQDPRTGMSGAIFDRPRVLSLFTDIPATTCFDAPDYLAQDGKWNLTKLLDLASGADISHIILDRRKSATWRTLHPIMDASPGYFRHVYGNPEFDIYQIRIP